MPSRAHGLRGRKRAGPAGIGPCLPARTYSDDDQLGRWLVFLWHRLEQHATFASRRIPERPRSPLCITIGWIFPVRAGAHLAQLAGATYRHELCAPVRCLAKARNQAAERRYGSNCNIRAWSWALTNRVKPTTYSVTQHTSLRRSQPYVFLAGPSGLRREGISSVGGGAHSSNLQRPLRYLFCLGVASPMLLSQGHKRQTRSPERAVHAVVFFGAASSERSQAWGGSSCVISHISVGTSPALSLDALDDPPKPHDLAREIH